MNDEIMSTVSLALDSHGFLRRECPACEQEFKWYFHGEGSADAEHVDQYFCPRCGQAADTDSWWTPAQLEYVQSMAGPAMDELANDLLDEMLKPLRNNKHVKVRRTGNFSLEIPSPDPLVEPDDMVIVESPCHPNEPVKVPEGSATNVFCLICGTEFVT